MSRRRWIYDGGDVVAEYSGDNLLWSKSPKEVSAKTATIIPDIEPYQSMATGEMITSRSRHRAHLREHRLVEIGNETKYLTQKRDVSLDPKFQQSRRELLYAQVDKAMRKR